MAAPSAVYPPEIWALESLIVLQNTHVVANLVHRNFEDEVATKGDVVHTRKPTVGTVKSLTNNAAITIATLDATDVAVTLDKHKYTAFRVSDRDMDTSVKNLVNEFVEPYIIPIAKQVDDDLLGSSGLTSSTIASVTATASGGPIDLADFAAVRGKLREQQCPTIRPEVVHGVLGTDHETEALVIEELVQANTYGANPPTLATGFMGNVYGMSIFADQGVPTGATTTEKQSCFFHKNAMALVTRPLEKPMAENVRTAVVQKDGVGIRAMMSYDHQYFSTLVTYDLLYGIKILDVNLACILTDF